MSRARTAPAYLEYAAGFNRKIRLLVADIMKRCPGDPVIARIQKRVALAIDHSPLFIIELAGAYLYRYQEKIYARDDAFFLENDYDRELKETANKERADAAQYLLPRVKECARTLTPAEKARYMDLVIEMLDDYVEFAAGRADEKAAAAPPKGYQTTPDSRRSSAP